MTFRGLRIALSLFPTRRGRGGCHHRCRRWHDPQSNRPPVISALAEQPLPLSVSSTKCRRDCPRRHPAETVASLVRRSVL
jgi:hypothetical protein